MLPQFVVESEVAFADLSILGSELQNLSNVWLASNWDWFFSAVYIRVGLSQIFGFLLAENK